MDARFSLVRSLSFPSFDVDDPRILRSSSSHLVHPRSLPEESLRWSYARSIPALDGVVCRYADCYVEVALIDFLSGSFGESDSVRIEMSQSISQVDFGMFDTDTILFSSVVEEEEEEEEDRAREGFSNPFPSTKHRLLTMIVACACSSSNVIELAQFSCMIVTLENGDLRRTLRIERLWSIDLCVDGMRVFESGTETLRNVFVASAQHVVFVGTRGTCCVLGLETNEVHVVKPPQESVGFLKTLFKRMIGQTPDNHQNQHAAEEIISALYDSVSQVLFMLRHDRQLAIWRPFDGEAVLHSTVVELVSLQSCFEESDISLTNLCGLVSKPRSDHSRDKDSAALEVSLFARTMPSSESPCSIIDLQIIQNKNVLIPASVPTVFIKHLFKLPVAIHSEMDLCFFSDGSAALIPEFDPCFLLFVYSSGEQTDFRTLDGEILSGFCFGENGHLLGVFTEVGTYLFVYDPVFEPLSSSSVADISTLLLENLTETVHELSEWLFSEIDNSFHILRDPAITRAHLSSRLEQYDLESARSNIEFSPIREYAFRVERLFQSYARPRSELAHVTRLFSDLFANVESSLFSQERNVFEFSSPVRGIEIGRLSQLLSDGIRRRVEILRDIVTISLLLSEYCLPRMEFRRQPHGIEIDSWLFPLLVPLLRAYEFAYTVVSNISVLPEIVQGKAISRIIGYDTCIEICVALEKYAISLSFVEDSSPFVATSMVDSSMPAYIMRNLLSRFLSGCCENETFSPRVSLLSSLSMSGCEYFEENVHAAATPGKRKLSLSTHIRRGTHHLLYPEIRTLIVKSAMEFYPDSIVCLHFKAIVSLFCDEDVESSIEHMKRICLGFDVSDGTLEELSKSSELLFETTGWNSVTTSFCGRSMLDLSGENVDCFSSERISYMLSMFSVLESMGKSLYVAYFVRDSLSFLFPYRRCKDDNHTSTNCSNAIDDVRNRLARSLLPRSFSIFLESNCVFEAYEMIEFMTRLELNELRNDCVSVFISTLLESGRSSEFVQLPFHGMESIVEKCFADRCRLETPFVGSCGTLYHQFFGWLCTRQAKREGLFYMYEYCLRIEEFFRHHGVCREYLTNLLSAYCLVMTTLSTIPPEYRYICCSPCVERSIVGDAAIHTEKMIQQRHALNDAILKLIDSHGDTSFSPWNSGYTEEVARQLISQLQNSAFASSAINISELFGIRDESQQSGDESRSEHDNRHG